MILVFEDKLGARSCFPSRLNHMKIRSKEFFLRAQKFIGTADGTYRRAIPWQSILDSRRGGRCSPAFLRVAIVACSTE